MAKDDYRLDLVRAKPADLAGYFRSALFSEWITSLDNESLWEAERAFQAALNKTADYRLARALAKGLHNVAANELAFRRRVKERQP